MARQEVTPLDPNSPWGKQLAAELSEVLAYVAEQIELRRMAEIEAVIQRSRATRARWGFGPSLKPPRMAVRGPVER